jgi:hypothetical protein
MIENFVAFAQVNGRETIMYKIKQLEWRSKCDSFHNTDRHYAVIFDMEYAIWEVDGIWNVELSRDKEVVFRHVVKGGLNEEKELAQKAFEWRIKQFLDEV